MISIIVYGRNDSHGYNLHKRAAISLNCIAELLTDADDEIIFVDYNTPDDFITFPEAIADTLTDRCKEKLRIIRVRPRHHNTYFKATTDLVALEPVSRNVGFRASNPSNRWILCTNTDMVFAAHDDAQSLTDVVRDLPDGFYELPRFEMPDLLWEGLDRKNPKENIRLMKEWGARYHINEILERNEAALFDGPGDFQLFLRKDIFAMDGFDERYNLGWHMDSNLCHRFHLLYGQTKSLDTRLAGWHCNHTRTQSIAHGSGRKSNSWDDVVKQVIRPDVPEQRDRWGLMGEQLEEIRLTASRKNAVFSFLDTLCPEPLKQPYRFANTSTDWVACPPEHLKPYIADILYPFPRQTIAAYIGADLDQFKCFVDVWRAMGFIGEILLISLDQNRHFAQSLGLEALKVVTPDEADRLCSLFVGGYCVWDPETYRIQKNDNEQVLALLQYMLALEQERAKSPTHTLRKFIFTNGVQYELCRLLQMYTNMQETPFGTRIRHGFVVPAKTAR